MVFLYNANCSYSTRIFELKREKEKGEEEHVLVRSFIDLSGGCHQLPARN